MEYDREVPGREGMPVSTAKQIMIEIIQEQPDDSSFEEILRELAFARMIDRGLEDSDAGRTVDNEEVRSRLDAWRKCRRANVNGTD